MTQTENIHSILDAPLQRHPQADSLQRQLYLRLRTAILQQQLQAGCRLPGSRGLAETLAISRNTVLSVYEQLTAEGFLVADKRGTVVASVSPQQPLSAETQVVRCSRRMASMRGDTRMPSKEQLFRVGIPALAQFPIKAWQKALEHAVSHHTPQVLNYGDPLGEWSLRQEIAHHLAISRGMRCKPEQVVITEGAQAALNLCVQLFSNSGEIGWIENPGYQGARTAMRCGELQLQPMPVDATGIVVTAADWEMHPPALIYTTPSHQYPTGSVLSVQRRLELIHQAKQHQAWIIEDDYDSEYRHSGVPVVAMQGLVDDAPVLYVGSFSKTLFPALRLGFLVLPERVMSQLHVDIANIVRGGNLHAQLALCWWMQSGQYSRHLARMRKLYRDRQAALKAALAEHLQIPHEILGGAAGLHLTVRLPAAYPDHKIAQAAKAHGMAVSALSAFACNGCDPQNGLVLGYGNTAIDQYAGLLQRLTTIAKACSNLGVKKAT